MNEESKKVTKNGKYSALEITFISLEENDVLCNSREVGVEWADGNDGWNVFD